MKTVAFMAAMLIGSAAIAQTTPTTPAPDASTMQPGTPTPPADTMTPPPAPMPMAGQPTGATGAVQFAPPQATPAPAAKDSYPVCSRTVRDSCRNPGGK